MPYSSEDGTRKYFEILVPNHDSASTLDSYLRLGTARTDGSASDPDPSQLGAALWGKFSKFLDKSNPPNGHIRDRTGTDARPPLYGSGDTRDNFHANLGWRDHCDGNRLTTTGGDKIEIVRGNYQLIVLGRGADGTEPVVVDASGGHLVDSADVTRIEYKSSKFGGTWKTTEETTRGHVHEIFKGEFKEEFRGSKQTSIVGTVPTALEATFNAEGTRGENDNPDILEGTWANTITEYTGSDGSRVGAITSSTYASSISDSINVTGTMSEQVIANAVTSYTYAKTIIEETGEAGNLAHITSTHWGNSNETQYGGSVSTLFGASVDTQIGAKLEFFLGAQVGIALAASAELFAGGHVELHLGAFREVTVGFKADVVVGTEHEFTMDSAAITAATRKEIAAAIFIG